jgi:Lrp/AsnC family transcriptional regulator, leucine-responsive regulatory protein
VKLDAINELILEALQQDGRLKNKALAARIGLSPPACLERVKRLEQAGIIVGYRAIIDPKAVGAHFDGWAEITLSDHSAEAVARFQTVVRGMPAIVSAYQVDGAYDFKLHFVAPSNAVWRDFRAHMGQFGVATARMSVVVEHVKAGAPVRLARHGRSRVREPTCVDLAR